MKLKEAAAAAANSAQSPNTAAGIQRPCVRLQLNQRCRIDHVSAPAAMKIVREVVVTEPVRPQYHMRCFAAPSL